MFEQIVNWMTYLTKWENEKELSVWLFQKEAKGASITEWGKMETYIETA